MTKKTIPKNVFMEIEILKQNFNNLPYKKWFGRCLFDENTEFFLIQLSGFTEYASANINHETDEINSNLYCKKNINELFQKTQENNLRKKDKKFNLVISIVTAFTTSTLTILLQYVFENL